MGWFQILAIIGLLIVGYAYMTKLPSESTWDKTSEIIGDGVDMIKDAFKVNKTEEQSLIMNVTNQTIVVEQPEEQIAEPYLLGKPKVETDCITDLDCKGYFGCTDCYCLNGMCYQ